MKRDIGMNPPLWTCENIAKAAGGQLVGPPGGDIYGISIDSRTLQPGDAFFAIKGDRLDGHEYVAKALAGGAALAVVDQERLGDLPQGGRYLLVPDVLESMGATGRAARARSTGCAIAITGSVGKTSTKEALRHVLAASGSVHAAMGSYNNHWGVPYTLAGYPETADFGIFEIGMNHAGEITPLTQLVNPDIAIVTTVAGAHLENFASIEDIARAKAEIFHGLVADGIAIVNADNAYTPLLIDAGKASGVATFIRFGEAPDADVQLVEAALLPGHSDVKISLFGELHSFRIGVPGRHIVQNALAIVAAAKIAGADLAASLRAFESLSAPEGRGARYQLHLTGDNATLIDESYNANPTSMRASFALLQATQPQGDGRRIAILGDMLELGAEGETLHAHLSAPLLAARTDLIFLSGPLMAALWDLLPPNKRGAYARQAEELIDPLFETIQPGDVILAKGSKGSRTSLVVKALLERYKPTQ